MCLHSFCWSLPGWLSWWRLVAGFIVSLFFASGVYLSVFLMAGLVEMSLVLGAFDSYLDVELVSSRSGSVILMLGLVLEVD